MLQHEMPGTGERSAMYSRPINTEPLILACAWAPRVKFANMPTVKKSSVVCPSWTLSTQTPDKRYPLLQLPVSDWFIGSQVAQSMENGHTITIVPDVGDPQQPTKIHQSQKNSAIANIPCPLSAQSTGYMTAPTSGGTWGALGGEIGAALSGRLESDRDLLYSSQRHAR